MPPRAAAPVLQRIGSDDGVVRLLRRLGGPSRIKGCYEVGPMGFGLARSLRATGVHCEVIPSLMPQPSGDTVETDQRDQVGVVTVVALVHVGALGRTSVADAIPALAAPYASFGSFAWWRRPANRLGALLVCAGASVLAASLLQTAFPALIAVGTVIPTAPLGFGTVRTARPAGGPRLHPDGHERHNWHERPGGAAVRVVIGEDETLLREGMVLLLQRAGFDVVAAEDDAARLVSAALRHRPDVVVTDIQMPANGTDDGLRAALKLRSRLPRTGVVVLSQHLSRQYALDLLATGPSGVGYLLKQRVTDVRRFTADLRHVATGGTVLDREIAAAPVARAEQIDGTVSGLTRRQREVLSLLAQGFSNGAIAQSLVITEKSVVEHVSKVYEALRLLQTGHEHRRVLAVLRYLSR